MIDLDETIPDEDALPAYFDWFSRPKGQRLVGVEGELLPIRAASGAAVGYAEPGGVRDLMEALSKRPDWRPLVEDDHVLGLQRGALLITLEPGGQVEVSTSPFPRLDLALDELDLTFQEIRACAAPLGLDFLALGMQPLTGAQDIHMIPKERYRIMDEYFRTHGGPDYAIMMRATSSVQCSLDYRSLEDAAEMLRISMLLAPIAVALFANSPLEAGAWNGHRSRRALTWTRTDGPRCGVVPGIFGGEFSVEAYCQFTLDVPMMFERQEGRLVAAHGSSFRRFLHDGRHGRKPTWRDWELQLSGIFTESRLKRFVEIRSADALPRSLRGAVPAFWMGLLYDERARSEAFDLVEGWDEGLFWDLFRAAALHGLDGRAGSIGIGELARRLLSVARGGLERIGEPTRHLDGICDLASAGRTPGHVALEQFERSGHRAVLTCGHG